MRGCASPHSRVPPGRRTPTRCGSMAKCSTRSSTHPDFSARDACWSGCASTPTAPANVRPRCAASSPSTATTPTSTTSANCSRRSSRARASSTWSMAPCPTPPSTKRRWRSCVGPASPRWRSSTRSARPSSAKTGSARSASTSASCVSSTRSPRASSAVCNCWRRLVNSTNAGASRSPAPSRRCAPNATSACTAPRPSSRRCWPRRWRWSST